MNIAVREVALGAVLAVSWAGSGLAQERTVDETLRELNQVLRDNAYIDQDGKHTVSQVSLRRGGTLVIAVAKTDAKREVSNIYQTDVDNIELEDVQSHQRGGHTVLMIGSRGKVQTKLKCVEGGSVTEWDLPERSDMPLEFKSESAAATQITDWLTQLVRLAREDPRYTEE